MSLEKTVQRGRKRNPLCPGCEKEDVFLRREQSTMFQREKWVLKVFHPRNGLRYQLGLFLLILSFTNTENIFLKKTDMANHRISLKLILFSFIHFFILPSLVSTSINFLPPRILDIGFPLADRLLGFPSAFPLFSELLLSSHL
jgi:hypothetical protein